MLESKDLTQPERAVWDAIETGSPVQLPLDTPTVDDPATGNTWGKDREIRAQLLYELLAGLNGPNDIRARALELTGARITGTLDLAATDIVCPLRLYNCWFAEAVNLEEASAPALRLHCCHLPGLNAQQLITRGNLELRDGCSVHGTVNLAGAHIGGDLRFDGSLLSNPGDQALSADCLRVDRSMHCSEGFAARGEISLVRAQIGSHLNFCEAALSNEGGPAINLQQSQAARLVLSPLTQPPHEIDLSYGHFGVLADASGSWPDRVWLHGLVYDALDENPHVNVKDRLDWLGRDPDHFSPQPYEQLAAVYRTAGRNDDARRVAIASQVRRRQTQKLAGRVWSHLLHWTVGYGYQTWRAGVWLLVLVGLGWLIFDWAESANPSLLVAPKSAGQRPSFNSPLYALDLLLPFVDLGYQSSWIVGGWARCFYIGWNLAGWVLITAVVAGLTGLIKRD